MRRVLLVTLYDDVALGLRILSSIAKSHNIEPHLVFFRRQRGRPTARHAVGPSSYQGYFNGVKYCSCFEAFPYTKTEVSLLVDLAKSIRPSLIGLSARSFAYAYCKEILATLRPAVCLPVIAGGWGPTVEPERFLECCDAVCFGEGEGAFAEICRRLNASQEANDSEFFEGVPNVLYWRNGSLRRNRTSSPLVSSELDRLPFPDYDPQNMYIIEGNRIRRHIYQVDEW